MERSRPLVRDIWQLGGQAMARDRKVEEAESNHKIILHVRISECLFTCLSSYLSDSQFCLPIPDRMYTALPRNVSHGVQGFTLSTASLRVGWCCLSLHSRCPEHILRNSLVF